MPRKQPEKLAGPRGVEEERGWWIPLADAEYKTRKSWSDISQCQVLLKEVLEGALKDPEATLENPVWFYAKSGLMYLGSWKKKTGEEKDVR